MLERFSCISLLFKPPCSHIKRLLLQVLGKKSLLRVFDIQGFERLKKKLKED